MINFFKGFIIGIGKIIPGVSGALLAISMGVYDKSIYYINNFKKSKKESIEYLTPIVIGVILSIIFFSKVIGILLDKYYLMTMLFFVGLIIGTLSSIIKIVDKKNYYLSIISVVFFLFISFISNRGEYIVKGTFFELGVFFLSGIFEAIGTIVPGVSSTALLMNIGTYKIVIVSIGNIMDFSVYNLRILFPFIMGTVIGLIIMVRVVALLFKKYYNKTYAIILGLLISTLIIMFVRAFKDGDNIIQFVIGVILMFIGVLLGYVFDK